MKRAVKRARALQHATYRLAARVILLGATDAKLPMVERATAEALRAGDRAAASLDSYWTLRSNAA